MTTVRDFTQVFDVYSQFEESLIDAKMEATAEAGPSENGKQNVRSCTTYYISSDDWDLELCLARFEDLMDRRPLLLSSVLLRQNPHNVHEWHKRVALFENNPREVLLTLVELLLSSLYSLSLSLSRLSMPTQRQFKL